MHKDVANCPQQSQCALAAKKPQQRSLWKTTEALREKSDKGECVLLAIVPGVWMNQYPTLCTGFRNMKEETWETQPDLY